MSAHVPATPKNPTPTPKDIAERRSAPVEPVIAPAVAVKQKGHKPSRKQQHAGKHRVSTAEFVEKEYNPFKTKTEQRLKDSEELLRVLAARSIGHTLESARVAQMEAEFASIRREFERTDVDDNDDPIIKKENKRKRKDLDERFSSFWRSVVGLVERVETRVNDHDLQLEAAHTIAIAQGKSISNHTERLNQQDTMIIEHDQFVTSHGGGKISLALVVIELVIAFLVAFIPAAIVANAFNYNLSQETKVNVGGDTGSFTSTLFNHPAETQVPMATWFIAFCVLLAILWGITSFVGSRRTTEKHEQTRSKVATDPAQADARANKKAGTWIDRHMPFLNGGNRSTDATDDVDYVAVQPAPEMSTKPVEKPAKEPVHT